MGAQGQSQEGEGGGPPQLPKSLRHSLFQIPRREMVAQNDSLATSYMFPIWLTLAVNDKSKGRDTPFKISQFSSNVFIHGQEYTALL